MHCNKLSQIIAKWFAAQSPSIQNWCGDHIVCESGRGTDDAHQCFIRCTLYSDIWRDLEYDV